MNRRLSSPTKTLVDDARAALASCAGLNSRLAARRITQFLENRMASTGLSVAQFGLVGMISSPMIRSATGIVSDALFSAKRQIQFPFQCRLVYDKLDSIQPNRSRGVQPTLPPLSNCESLMSQSSFRLPTRLLRSPHPFA
jgi:hypothetical protein